MVEVYIPETVTSIGLYAFDNCVSLKVLDIKGNCECPYGIVHCCASLEYISIPYLVPSSRSENYVFPPGIGYLFSTGFSGDYDYSALQNVHYIVNGNYSSSYISRYLEEVHVNYSTSLPDYAFYGVSMNTIYIKGGHGTYGEHAVSYVSDFYYDGTLDEWNSMTFNSKPIGRIHLRDENGEWYVK